MSFDDLIDNQKIKKMQSLIKYENPLIRPLMKLL